MEQPQTDRSVPEPMENAISFSGGMRDRDHPSLLDPNQYAYGKDIEIRDSGLARLREGRTQKCSTTGSNPQGAFFFKPQAGSTTMVILNGGNTYLWNGTSTSPTALGSTTFANTTENIASAILNQVAYVSPGQSDNGRSWDGAAADWTDEGNTNADAPRGTLLCQQSGRLCAAGESTTSGRQDYTSFSDIFDGHTWDRTANNKRTPTDGSEAITAINTYRKEEILVHTAFSTHSWNISGSTVSPFTRITLDAKLGCIAPRSVVVIGDDAFFLSADLQLRSIKRTVQDLAFGVTNPVTYFVPNLMERINPLYAHRCAAIFYNNYYLLACPLDNSTRNNAVIAFDMLHQLQTPSGNMPVCVGEWTNMSVNQFVITYFSGVAKLHYLDDTDGSIKQMFDGSTNDDGAEIVPQIDFRAFDYKFPNNPKTAVDGVMQFLGTSGIATLSFAKDDAQFTTIGTKQIGGTSALLPVFLPFQLSVDSGVTPWYFTMYGLGQSRYWQPRLTFNGRAMNLKQLTLRSYVEKFQTR